VRKGRFFDDDGVEFKRGREPTRKEEAREANLAEADIEDDEDDENYMIGDTVVPHHLEHWFEDPFGIKSSRDRYLIDKWEKMRKRHGPLSPLPSPLQPSLNLRFVGTLKGNN